jgi:hypothetical protein
VSRFEGARRADAGRTATITVGRETGWRLDVPDGGPALGAKSLRTGGATLTIGSYRENGVHKVSIALEHRACPQELCGDD